MTVSRLGMTVMAALITVVGASLPAAAFAQWWNPLAPKTYDECILKNMKGVTSDKAADMITLSCLEQFEEKRASCTLRELTAAERSKVSGRASVSNYSTPYLSARVYNGNADISVNEITVKLSARNIDPPQEYKLYLRYPIEPLSSNDVGTTLQIFPENGTVNWSVTSMKTCR